MTGQTSALPHGQLQMWNTTFLYKFTVDNCCYVMLGGWHFVPPKGCMTQLRSNHIVLGSLGD